MKHSKSSLFLMELILALLFFSLASTVCIRLFVKSHTISTNTQDLNYAVTQSQNLAESFIGFDGDMQAMKSLFETSKLNADNSLLTVYEGDYYSTLLFTKQLCDNTLPVGNTISADITICRRDSNKVIYTLHVDHYIPERMANNE